MAKKIKDIQKPDVSAAEKEREAILRAADSVKGEQLLISSEGSFATAQELKDLIPDMTDNPSVKYDIYYKGIQKLLRDNLPKGDYYKKAREYIYEEKNVFLTRGFRKNKRGIRLADSRMGYLPDDQEMLEILVKWASSKDTMYNLFEALKDLNEKRGYNKVKK